MQYFNTFINVKQDNLFKINLGKEFIAQLFLVWELLGDKGGGGGGGGGVGLTNPEGWQGNP